MALAQWICACTFLLTVVGRYAAPTMAGHVGKEFVFLPIPNHVHLDQRIGVILQPATHNLTMVNISAPWWDLHNHTVLTAWEPVDFPLPATLVNHRTSDVVNSTVIITADNDITVVVYNRRNRTTDTYTAVPSKNFGREYFVSTFSHEGYPVSGSGVFVVSALNTSVSLAIYLNSTVQFKDKSYFAGDTLEHQLLPYESLQLFPQYINITGTRILANTSIAVTVGSECASVPNTIAYCDHIAEQLLPFSQWGKAYLMSPLPNRTTGYIFHIVAGRDNTEVSSSGSSRILNMGDFAQVDVQSQTMTLVTADKPVSIMYYAKGHEIQTGNYGPSMMRITAIEHYSRASVVPVQDAPIVDSNVDDVFYGLTAECDLINNVSISKNLFPQQVTWLEEYIGGTTTGVSFCTRWSAATNGTYTFESLPVLASNGDEMFARFQVVIYGTGNGESHLYTHAGYDTANLTCVDLFDRESCFDTDECASNPCQNSATCIDGANGYTCTCVPGYTGIDCETDTDECASNPCQNSATCIDGANEYTCTCVPGYTGIDCETDTDECASIPCQNGATCIDGVNGYTCTCVPGYTGKDCETEYTDECGSNPCHNGATCIDGVNGYMCMCVHGYTGIDCETDTDECESNPCQNGATCIDGVNGYTCTCAPGYTGKDCETEYTDECGSNPCHNGATCITGVNGYMCTCVHGYTGIDCETVYDPCNMTNDCSGIRICVSNLTTSTYTCICPDEYTMDQSTGFCVEIDKCADPSLNDCDENALCYQSGTSYTCTCTSGFTGSGTSCEVDKQPCESSPCFHGALCTNGADGSFDCTCDEPYEGELCNVKKDPVLPVTVTVSPQNQTVSTTQRVELMCDFENAVQFWWEKDGVKIPGTDNQNTYVILTARPLDIGYYRCVGTGAPTEGSSARTETASLYIQDLTNVVITGARFNYSVDQPQDLLNSSTTTYRDTVNEVTTFLQAGLPNTDGVGNTPLSVVVTDLRPGSVIADFNVFVEDTETSPFVLQDLVTSSLQQLDSQTGIFSTTQITVNSTSICQPIVWESPFGRVSFGEGTISSMANSTGITCPFNTTNADQPAGKAQCVGDKISFAQWQPEDNCGPFRDVTELLEEIQEVIITNETVSLVTEHVEIITENTDQITSSAITLVSNIASNIGMLESSDAQVTTSVASIVSNIAQADVSELQAAEEEDNSISTIVQVFEEQLNIVEVEEGEPFNIAEENIAVQVQSIPSQELKQGLVLSVSGDGSSDLSGTNITSGSHTSDQLDTDSTFIAQVNVPAEVSAIEGNENEDSVRVIFTIFATPSLFMSRSVQTFSEGNDDVNRTANTPVIALSIGGVVVENLHEPVNLTFTTLERGYEDPTCVYWNATVSDWSTRGCNILPYDIPSSEDTYGNANMTETYVCACNHLTNFAILMDIHDANPEKAYTILSYIGCSISIVCLVVTLATYLWNRTLRTRQTHQIFICLCATLLGLYTTFILMLALDTNRNRQEVASGACGFLASLVHYFALSSITWMGVEGYNTYLVIVRVFNSYIDKFMMKAYIVAWGGPALIVILTGAIANRNYSEVDICFLRLWPRIGGLLIPMAVILIANVVIFILVVRQLVLSTKVAGKGKMDKKDERRATIERIQNAIAILVIFGLTWIAGYLLLIEAFSQVGQALFITFNSFQGLIIFLLYCVRKPVIRQQWGLTCSFFGGVQNERSGSGTSPSTTSFSTSSGPSWASNMWSMVYRKKSLTGESTTELTNSDVLASSAKFSKDDNGIVGVSISKLDENDQV